MKTYSAKPSEVTRQWYVIDASTAPLGRMATTIATKLMGKDKPMFTAHIDCGDYVVVANSDKLVVTGTKKESKDYYRHSQYPGGIKKRTLQEQMDLDSAKVIEDAVYGMLPTNKLRNERMKRLKVYKAEHKNEAQKPVELEVRV
ncbi:MAG: 50S ribosomal protein L13 [bacterium]|nr:50S ribosomal protein L13 [bacterium]